MTNLVAITVKATDSSDYTAIKASAAKAGADAADEFNKAFKLKADAHARASESGGSEGLLGTDSGILSRLKSYANTPGGIGMLGTGSDTSLVSMLKNQIRAMGQNGGPSLLSGMSEGGQSTTDMVREVLQNSVTGNVTTSDFIKQVLEGAGPGNVTTSDYIKQVVEGNTPGNISTEDIIHPMVDDSDIAALGAKDGKTYGGGFTGGSKDELGGAVDDAIKDSDVADKGSSDGKSYGSSFASSLMSTLTKALSGGGKGGGGSSVVGSLLTGGGGSGDAGAVAGALDSGGVAGGALPGVAGVSGTAATVTGLAGALVAVLPAITAVASGLGAIGGGFAILLATSKSFKSEMTSDLGDIEKSFGQAAAPLAKPLEQAATEIVGYFKQIEPDLKMVFADSATLIQPLVKGFEALMTGAGPGFLAMIKSAGPVFATVGQAFANLGKSLGTMFSDFASDGAGSAVILKSFLEIINSLLPFIGELGKILVSALAPAFSAFAGALTGVLPALKPLMSILGSFAGAVLTDLGSILTALGGLLVKLAPSFTLLGKAATSVFTAMENDGVFASLGNALESLGTPIANLINALVKALLPALPGIIAGFDQFSRIFTGTVVTAVSAFAVGLAAIVTAIPQPVINGLIDAFIIWKSATLALTVAQAALNAIMDLNPFVAVGVAVAVVAGLIIKYHTQILSFIEQTWNTVYSFIKGIWDDILSFAEQWWPLLLGPGGVIMKYHTDIENSIKSAWNGILSWLKGIWDDISSAASSAWNAIWSSVKNAVTSGVNEVKTIVGALPGDIEGYFKSAGNWLISFGGDVISGFWTGLKDAWQSVVSWFENIPSDILHALGIHSPPDWAISAGKDIMSGLAQGAESTANKVISAAEKAAAAAAAKLANVASGGSGMPTTSANGSIQALMEQMAAARGWQGLQWSDLYQVEMREAGFDMTATNPTSGAYGLAQFIGGPSEYAQYGGNANTAAGQITAMLNYIAQRYGNPEAAWAHEEAYGWYDQGGWLPTGKSIAVNNTGAPERVIGPGGINVQLEVASGGQGSFEAFMSGFIKNYVRIKGGGNVQSAFGRT